MQHFWPTRKDGPASTANKPGGGAGEAEASSCLSSPHLLHHRRHDCDAAFLPIRTSGPASTAGKPGGGAGALVAVSLPLFAFLLLQE